MPSSPRKGSTLSSYETTTNGPAGAEPDTGKAQEAAQVAQEKAQEAKGKARDRVRDEVDTRSTQAGEQAEGVAQDVRSVGEHLRSQGKDKPAELADKAAERVAEISDYLKRSDGDAILRDAERLGRDKPWAVIGRRDRVGHRRFALLEGVEQPPLPRARELVEPAGAPCRRGSRGDLGRARDGRRPGDARDVPRARRDEARRRCAGA